MNLRTLSCLLGIFALFVVLKPSFADPLSSLVPLKERLMNAKPNAFEATNVRELYFEMMARFPDSESGEHPERQSEYAAYCGAVYEAAWALDILENHLLQLRAEEKLDDFEDRFLQVESMVSKAEAYKTMCEFDDLKTPITDEPSFVEDDTISVEEQALSSDNEQSSLDDPLSYLAPLKERLMNAKPKAFVATNVHELFMEMMTISAEHLERESEYAAYCEAVYEAAWALDILEHHLLQLREGEELEDLGDRFLTAEILVNEAEDHKNMYEFGNSRTPIMDGHSFVEGNRTSVEEHPLSAGNQQQIQMISKLKGKLSETAPSFEGVDIFDVEQWRTQKEAELELATKESAAPMQDLNVLQAKVDYEYALYCETASKASETLNTLEAQLASVEPLEESFDDGLSDARDLVSQVEARKLAYSDALDSLQTPREDTSSLVEDDLTCVETPSSGNQQLQQARRAELHQLRIDLLLTAPRVENVYIFDIEQWRAKKEAELELVTKESAAPMQDLNVLEAKVDYECALYCETAFKAFKALDTLEAQFLQASVEPLNESFDDGLSDARDLVSQVADCKLSYADALEDVKALKEDADTEKSLSPQPIKESSIFQRLKSRIFSGW